MKPRILITSGPTREYIDDVRYLSNASSGMMGAALVSAALKRRAEVTFISGPAEVAAPPRARLVAVVSAADMFAAVKKNSREYDIIIGAAAVADYRPLRLARGKIKRTDAAFTLTLVPNPDIIAWAGLHRTGAQVVGGFALETSSLLARARKKMKDKRLDFIVANRASAIASRRSAASILFPDGTRTDIAEADKTIIAEKIIDEAIRIWKVRQTC